MEVTVEMQLIAKGREATVYRKGKGVVWIGNGPDVHPECVMGWSLCRDLLSPPHFPEIYSIKLRNGCLYVEMEYLPGGPPTKWNEREAMAILSELGKAGVFHRDIRPENLVMRGTGEWCLIDFGWACTYDDPYPGPSRLGGSCRSPHGPDDRYAMHAVKEALGG